MPFPLPFSHLPSRSLALPSLPCLERTDSGRVLEDAHFLLKAGPFQGTCWCLLHLQSHRGKVWECPGLHACRGPLAPGIGTEQNHNKTYFWLTEFQTDTTSSMDPWSCQMVIMRKSAGNTSFLWLFNSSCACFSVLAFVNSQSTNVLGVFCTVCGQWQIYIQHWMVISIFSFLLGIVCTGKAKQQASLH